MYNEKIAGENVVFTIETPINVNELYNDRNRKRVKPIIKQDITTFQALSSESILDAIGKKGLFIYNN